MLDMNTDVLEPFISNSSQISNSGQVAKNFKEQTNDYIDALNHFLEEEQHFLEGVVENELCTVLVLLTNNIVHL